MNLSTKELIPSNVKLIQALEEIKQKTLKPIPLIEGYLDCIYSYNRKIGVDIKDYIREPLAKFTSMSITDQLLNNIPVSTNIELTKEEEVEFKKASEQAKEQPNLGAALKNLYNAAPLPAKSLISKIIDYAKYVFNSIKNALGNNVSQDTTSKFTDSIISHTSKDNQRSR